MTKRSILLLAGAAMLSSTGPAGAELLPPMLTGAPSPTVIAQRCELVITRSRALRTRLEAPTRLAPMATLQLLDDNYFVLSGGYGEFKLFREAHDDAAAREAAQACEVRIGAELNAMALSRPIYDRIKALPAMADPATRWMVKRTLLGFEGAGVAVEPAKRAEARALADRISELSSAFAANIPKGQREIKVTPAGLAGLPADFIARKKVGADGTITLRTDTADVGPVMTYARDRDLRQRLQREYMLRAYPANDTVLRELIAKRMAFARLVGRRDHASLEFESGMLTTPARVETLLADMAAAARPAAEADYAKKLAAFRQIEPGASRFEAWDNSFLNPIVQKQFYGFDRQEARRYFAFPKVRDGILQLSEDLFGIDIRPWNTPLWHAKAGAYEVFEKGKLIGRFYLDMHPRPGKYQHANVITIRPGTRTQLPVTALVMNAPDGLMEHSEVVTFLHEYGHLLHVIFSGQNQRWAAQSGIATEADFGEAPSQMLENFVFDYDTLRRFATDDGGKPIPEALVAQMNRARYFDVGMTDLRQLGLANVSLRFYQQDPPADLGAAYRRHLAAFDLLPVPEGAQPHAAFSHLANYGAAYYTYLWSRVIADDLFTRFRNEGLRNPRTAAAYRRLVLAPGGSKPAAQLVEDFLGRPIGIEAYRANLAKGR